MHWLMMLCSAGLLGFCAHLWAARWARTAAEYTFVAVAAGVLQVGTIALGLSLVGQMTWMPWLAVQALVMLPAAWFCRAKEPPVQPIAELKALLRSARGPAKLIPVAIGFILLLTFAKQVLLPVSHMDDRNYRASRAAYWLQHQSILPWPTHNDRQTVFPLVGELLFHWPLQFTRSEPAGLALFWLAYPLCIAGVYAVLRELGRSALVASMGALLMAFTPMVLLHTRGVNPELWTAGFVIASAFWLLRATHEASTARWVLAGVFAGLAVSAKSSAVPLLLVLPVTPWLLPTVGRLRAAGLIVGGAVAAAVLSGSIVVYGTNLIRHHHPLGPAGFRETHTAQINAQQVRTHAARMLVTLFEPPVGGRALEGVYAGLLDRFNAGQPLPMEDQPWPGEFQLNFGPVGGGYSFAGWLWLPALVVAVMMWRRDRRLLVLALLSGVLLFAAAFGIRWMGGMGRFWLAAFTLAVPVIVTLVSRLAERRRWVGVVGMAGVVFVVGVGTVWRLVDVRHTLDEVNSDTYLVSLDEPFAEPINFHIPPGATTLLVAGQGARDYPLFRPRERFANRVILWGQRPFDPAVMQDLLQREKVDFVLVENEQQVDFHWAPPLITGPIVAWLDAHWRPVPLEYSPGMRLYVKR